MHDTHEAALHLSELSQEAVGTRALLALLPSDHLEWRPHPKSQTLRELASHLVNLPSWVPLTLEQAELDLAADPEWKTPQLGSVEEALTTFEVNLALAKASLERASEATFQEPWTLRSGARVHLTQPKSSVLRGFVFNHSVHHRAQLGVYLRLLNIPLPSVYGPTADTPGM